MTQKLPGPPPLPREEPATAPPPDRAGRRYVSAEMQKVADSGKPPSADELIAAQDAEIKALQEKVASIGEVQRQLSESDGTQNEEIRKHERDIGLAIAAAQEAKAAALSLTASNDLGAKKAEEAATGIGKLDAKAWLTLIVALIGSVLALVRALKGDPTPVALPPQVIQVTVPVADAGAPK